MILSSNKNKFSLGIGKNGFSYLALMALILMLWSCGEDTKEFVPDVTGIEISNDIIRFEQLLAQLDTNNLEHEIDSLSGRLPEFTDIFFTQVLPFTGKTEEDFIKNLRGYLGDPRIQKLQDTVLHIFQDIEQRELEELQQSMKYMKYYFEDFSAPNIYTFISEYTYQKFIFQDGDKDGIGIGLDLFLGRGYDYKSIDPQNPAFSEYLTRSFDRDYIPKMMLEVLIDDQLGRVPGSRLIDNMIHNGKKLYILDKVLPGTPDSILLEYTAEQTEWVKSNELEMWAFFFDQELFYESNSMKIDKYINPSPHSPGMPDKAPGRTANYIGWKIIQAYMQRFPKTSIPELIELKDAQAIMDESRYKPKRK